MPCGSSVALSGEGKRAEAREMREKKREESSNEGNMIGFLGRRSRVGVI